jgi:hypothetical protein
MNDDLHWYASGHCPMMASSWTEVPAIQEAMAMRDGNLAGWILTVVALLVLASEGNFAMLTVLIPISFLLACVMIGPGHARAEVTKIAKRGRLELKK